MQMDTATHYRVKLESAPLTVITLVGAGGTGSALAVDLARLMYHVRQSGGKIHMQIVDHDRVERKNVGRQQFAAADVGRNKAESLAERLNMWLGLDIAALPERFTKNTPLYLSDKVSARRILVGAVDNHRARREMAASAYMAAGQARWWIDAGNGEHSGQVLIGNLAAGEIQINDVFGLVDGLPAPSVQMPGLLEPEETAVAPQQADCALAVIRDEQSLNVNRMMAVIAAQYVYDMVVRNEVTTMGAHAALRPPSVTSLPITLSALERCETLKIRRLVWTEKSSQFARG
jgi:PRTRC genetic system ThiF family protein